MSSGTDASRRFERLEPLPEAFALTAAETTSSAMHRRVVFVALAEDGSTAALRGALAGRQATRVVSSRLFAAGMEAPWHMFQVPSDVGLSPLLRWSQFLAFQRRLADDLLLPATRPGELLIDWTAAHANPRSLAPIASLFPDALVVVDASVATALPPWLRARVHVYDDLDATLAAIDEATRPVPARAPAPNASTSPLQDRLVVVLGSARSGTTWLQQLWLTHDRVAGVPGNESWLFHQLRLLWQAFEDRAGVGEWLDRPTFLAALRRYCDNVFVAVRDRFGGPDADYVVEKSPVHVHQVARIAAVYPDAWMVHLIRDGRHVARSISQVPFFELPDIGDAAALWDRSVTAVREQQQLVPRFHEVRYEELVRDPAATMRRLWSWVGLDPPPTDQSAFGSAVATPVSAHRRGSTKPPPEAGARELATIYRHAGRTLVREGYVSRSAVWRARLTRRGSS
jgi:hypothetical protein